MEGYCIVSKYVYTWDYVAYEDIGIDNDVTTSGLVTTIVRMVYVGKLGFTFQNRAMEYWSSIINHKFVASAIAKHHLIHHPGETLML